MPTRVSTRKPLMVWGSVKLRNTASASAGACSGVGASCSIRCLNVQTPRRESPAGAVKPVRTGSSTTLTARIISSLLVITRQRPSLATL